MSIDAYLDRGSAPEEPPSRGAMDPATAELHRAVDDAMRRHGRPYLHPEGETIQVDLLGSGRMIAWQEEKASRVFLGSGCWSEISQTYGRYGTEVNRRLIERVKELERAGGAVLADSGMQAAALLFDVLLERGDHAVVARSAYNKSKSYLKRLAEKLGGSVSQVDGVGASGVAEALRETTRLVFVEAYTNPLMRAPDPAALGALAREARAAASPRVKLIVDNTIATPWGLARPALETPGVDFVVASGTKALGGQDRDLWGYVASNAADTLNEVMDLQAMRGGILDWRRAKAILAGLPEAEERFERRCETASALASFLSEHPRVGEVFHPSLADHPDAGVIRERYRLPGSIVSFRLKDADEESTRHFCDVLAMTGIPRYALSFDGLVTKINHHRSVSEYFTAEEEIERIGVGRLVRLGVGLEAPRDLAACLNWSLWSFERFGKDDVARWQEERARELGLT